MILMRGNRMTAEDVAKELGVSKTWVYKMASKKEIPHFRLGGVIFFHKDVFHEWVSEKFEQSQAN